MSLINTYVSVSQFFRKVGTSIRKKLISKLEAELFRTEIDLAKAEEKRSENMTKLHQEHYKAAAAIGEQKASIAVVSQAIADDLKSRRAALSSELDKLVG